MTASNSNAERLTEKEKAVLFAAYAVLNSRSNIHISIQVVRRSLSRKAQFKLKKPLGTLVSLGYLREGPTAGGMTYYPTRLGMKRARELFPSLFPE